MKKQTNLWIPLSQLYIQLCNYFLTSLNYEKPWQTSMVMAPAELSLLYSVKVGVPRHRKEEAVIGQLWRAD